MTCPRCGREIEWLACPACTKLNSREATFQMQGSHLENARRGLLPFYSKRLSGRHPWHLMLFGDRAHGFCGIEIATVGKDNRRETPYADLDRMQQSNALCPACLNTLHAIEIQQAEADAIRGES